MYQMHIYRDGALPASRQQYHAAAVEVLRCDYWVLQVWNHANLAAPYWRLYWNREAGAEVLLGEERFALTPDRMLLIAPHTPFTTQFNGTGRPVPADNVMVGCPAAEWDPAALGRVVRHLFIHFTAGAPYDMLTSRVMALPVGAQVRGLVDLLLPALSQGHALNRQQSFALQALLLQALAQAPDDVWPDMQTDSRVAAVLRHIAGQYHQRLCNADFATIAAMSPKAFVRLFKEKTGRTPLEYLLITRVEQASILLHHTDDSIEQIAERCGFCDRHHFSKAFQRQFGLGPAAFRRQRMP